MKVKNFYKTILTASVALLLLVQFGYAGLDTTPSQTIDDQDNRVYGFSLDDCDSDGDLDLIYVTKDKSSTYSDIYVYTNDGDQTFTYHSDWACGSVDPVQDAFEMGYLQLEDEMDIVCGRTSNTITFMSGNQWYPLWFFSNSIDQTM